MAKIRNSGKSLGFIKKHYSQLAAVVYADIFGFPITVSEAKLWAIRKQREEYSLEKFNQAIKIVSFLKFIPFVEAIFLTGSAAANNAKRDADADLMIISSPNSVWLTRAIVFIVLKFLKKLKNPICPNIFLDLNHLEIQDKNLFTAHEVLQAKCLYDRNGVEKKWLEKNKWTREYLPNVYKHKINNNPMSNSNFSISNVQFPNWVLDFGYWVLELGFGFLNFFALMIQYLYMKPKMTNESVGWGSIFFHPNNLSKKILKKFEKNLQKTGCEPCFT